MCDGRGDSCVAGACDGMKAQAPLPLTPQLLHLEVVSCYLAIKGHIVYGQQEGQTPDTGGDG